MFQSVDNSFSHVQNGHTLASVNNHVNPLFLDLEDGQESRRKKQNRLYQRKHRQRSKGSMLSRNAEPSIEQVQEQVTNVLSTVPPGSIENTHGNGGNAQGLESPIMVTDFSVTQMVGNFLEHDQRRQDSWLASSGRGSCQESEFQNLPTKPLEKGNTPLHQAVAYGQLSIVRLLLGRGADRRSVNTLGKTPLHLAAELGDLEMVQSLSNDRYVINMQDKCGSTALHLAAMAGHHEVAQLLLDGGADIEARI